MYRDLTKGNITKTLLVFSLPMIAGNLLQQFYNIADTLIVGKFLGRDALAAVGSAYTGTAAGRHCSGIRPDFSADGNFVHSGLSVA